MNILVILIIVILLVGEADTTAGGTTNFRGEGLASAAGSWGLL